ncbi:hypothetical protein WA538_004704, partial [Blastocystis sp. DL]
MSNEPELSIEMMRSVSWQTNDIEMEQIDESKTGMQLLRDEELMDSVNPMNSTLVSYVNLPRIANDLMNIFLSDVKANDDFTDYKAPYLAANCLSLCSPDTLQDLFSKEDSFHRLFSLLFGQTLNRLRLGLFQVVVRALVQKIPCSLYAYLSANSDWILRELSSHYNNLVMLNISRFLLDIPLTNDVAWWENDLDFCNRFVDLLCNPSTSPNASHFFTSLLYRAFFTPDQNTSCFSLSKIVTSSDFVSRLLHIALTHPDETVAESSLQVVSRILWTTFPTEDFGLGGFDPSSTLRSTTLDWEHAGVVPAEQREEALQVVVANAENVRNVLEDSVRKPKEKMRLSVEVPKCPKRVIGIASLVRYAVVASSMEQLMAIADSGVIDTLFEAMFSFPFCSLLHLQLSTMMVDKLKDQDSFRVFSNHTSLLHLLCQNENTMGPFRGPIQAILTELLSTQREESCIPAAMKEDWLKIKEKGVVNECFDCFGGDASGCSMKTDIDLSEIPSYLNTGEKVESDSDLPVIQYEEMSNLLDSNFELPPLPPEFSSEMCVESESPSTPQSATSICDIS